MQPEGHFRLTVRQGLTPGKVFELARDVIVIGRDLKADVVLNDPEISRNHCRLIAQGNGYQVEDLESTNGTFVNSQKVTAPRMLQPGDLVGLGENLVLEFGVSDAAAATIVMQPGAHIPLAQTPPPPPPPPMEAYAPPPVEAYAPPPSAMPDMSAGMPPLGEPAAPSEPAWMAAPPAAPIITPKKSNRNLIIAIVVAAVVLCCCCPALVGGIYYVYNTYVKTQMPVGGWQPLLSILLA
jgi:hypothetical protein